MFKLRYIFPVVLLVLGVQGIPKPLRVETAVGDRPTRAAGFFDFLTDYFYDDDDDDDSDEQQETYLICRNCTVVINQQNQTAGTMDQAAQQPAQPPAPAPSGGAPAPAPTGDPSTPGPSEDPSIPGGDQTSSTPESG